MKKVLLYLFCTLFLNISLKSQTWEKTFPWNTISQNYGTRGYYFDNNEGFILVSELGGYANPNNHLVIKINANGDTLWTKSISLQSYNIIKWQPTKITKSKKNYLLAGYGRYLNSWTDDGFFTVLIDSNANVLNIDSTKLNNTQGGNDEKIITSKSGNFCYGLYSKDTSVGFFSNVYTRNITKYDSLGNRLWTKTHRSVIDSFIQMKNLRATHDDGLIYTKFAGNIDSLYKMDGNKNLQWSLRVNNLIPNGTLGSTISQDIICTKDTNYLLSVQWADQTIFPFTYKSYLIRLNAQGVITDSTSFSGQISFLHGVQTSNNKFLFSFINGMTGTYVYGYTFFDNNLNVASTHISPFSYNYHYLTNGIIANNMGGGFLACDVVNTQNTFAVNFDSTFAAYPNHVSAKVVLDHNKNCIQNTTDSLLNNSVITITDALNNNYYAFSDGSGNYNITVPNNTYTLTHTPVGYKQFECPGISGQIPYTTSLTSNFNCTFFDTIIPNVSDVNLYMVSDFIQSNDTARYFALCWNEGTTNANGTVTIIKDPCLQFISSIPAPLSVTGNTLTFSVSNLNPDSTAVIQMNLNTCTTNSVGSTVYMYGEANFVSDVKQSNNFDTIVGTIYPGSNKSLSNITNSKIVSQPLYINGDKELVYRIKYQNTTSQTIKDIIIVDTISSNLDVSTFKLLRYTGDKPSIKWGSGNKLTFTFSDYNIPSSTLDPNNSKGEMVYAIKPKQNLPPNSIINNSASIFFDYLDVYTTTKTKNIIRPFLVTDLSQNSAVAKEIEIFPNPANNYIQIKSEINALYYYQIIDIQGKDLNQRTKLENDKINISHLTDGLYILRITENNKPERNFKLIVNH